MYIRNDLTNKIWINKINKVFDEIKLVFDFSRFSVSLKYKYRSSQRATEKWLKSGVQKFFFHMIVYNTFKLHGVYSAGVI